MGYFGGSFPFMGNNCACKLGVIPYRNLKCGKFEILLVTTLGGKWSLPKGNLIKRLGPTRTAQLEAYEEAGISGKIIDQPPFIRKAKQTIHLLPFQGSQGF